MSYSNECEACSVSVYLSPEEINALFVRTVDVDNVELSSEEEYGRRVSICMGCDCLLYNTTCVNCGCIIQVKARVKNAACPYPYNSKW